MVAHIYFPSFSTHPLFGLALLAVVSCHTSEPVAVLPRSDMDRDSPSAGGGPSYPGTPAATGRAPVPAMLGRKTLDFFRCEFSRTGLPAPLSVEIGEADREPERDSEPSRIAAFSRLTLNMAYSGRTPDVLAPVERERIASFTARFSRCCLRRSLSPSFAMTSAYTSL